MRRTTGSLTGVARLVTLLVLTLATLTLPARVFAQQPEAAAPAAQEHAAGGEVNIVLPDLSQTDVGGFNGRTLLMGGIAVAIIGIGFGLLILNQLKNLPVLGVLHHIPNGLGAELVHGAQAREVGAKLRGPHLGRRVQRLGCRRLSHLRPLPTSMPNHF